MHLSYCFNTDINVIIFTYLGMYIAASRIVNDRIAFLKCNSSLFFYFFYVVSHSSV